MRPHSNYDDLDAKIMAGANTQGGIVWMLLICVILALLGFWLHDQSQRADALRPYENRHAKSGAEALEMAKVKCQYLPAGSERDGWCRISKM